MKQHSVQSIAMLVLIAVVAAGLSACTTGKRGNSADTTNRTTTTGSADPNAPITTGTSRQWFGQCNRIG